VWCVCVCVVVWSEYLIYYLCYLWCVCVCCRVFYVSVVWCCVVCVCELRVCELCGVLCVVCL